MGGGASKEAKDEKDKTDPAPNAVSESKTESDDAPVAATSAESKTETAGMKDGDDDEETKVEIISDIELTGKHTESHFYNPSID